jgi:tRNA A37 threonylcarbamoyladenosine synthetase subunit TsaC/SUA5/YrdC
MTKLKTARTKTVAVVCPKNDYALRICVDFDDQL